MPSLAPGSRRIVATNPDGLGDFLLREPLYRTLTDDGHALLLLVRPVAAPLAGLLFPAARRLVIPFDPYSPDEPASLDNWRAMREAIVEFGPDLLLLAPQNWTSLEYGLARMLSGIEQLRQEPLAPGQQPHELEMNLTLARRVTGREVAWRRPQLEVTPEQRAQGREILASLRAAPGSFWMATCGTGAQPPKAALSNWSEAQWAGLIRHGIEQHGRRFLLVGTAAEAPAHALIRESLGPLADQVHVLSDLPLEPLLGLLAEAEGYLGRDTGMAHLAAATDRPVLTLLGGGHGARFVPAARRGHTFTVAVPCVHCQWECRYSESWCVKAVPLATVTAAFDDLVVGRHETFHFRQLDRPAALEARMELERLAQPRPAPAKRRIHIGHHFYGAGNIGDDFMLAGFLRALATAPFPFHFTCCIPFDLEPMRRRFPQIEWRPYTLEARREAIESADHWLGLGDTPFQTDGGLWLVEHLHEEAALCEAAGKAMYFLGCGVNNAAALENPLLQEVLARAVHVWTRDAASADLLEAQAPGRITRGADLANLWLGSRQWPRPIPESIGMILNFENEASYSVEGVERIVEAYPVQAWHWSVQDVRELPGNEKALWSALPEGRRIRLPLAVPDYEQSAMEDLAAPWPPVATLLSSRYHGALAGAWQGAKLVCLERNDKLRGLVRQLEVPLLALPDAEGVIEAIATAAAVPEKLLRGLEAEALAMCQEYFAVVAARPVQLVRPSPPSLTEVEHELRRQLAAVQDENRIQTQAAAERLALVEQLHGECARLQKQIAARRVPAPLRWVARMLTKNRRK